VGSGIKRSGEWESGHPTQRFLKVDSTNSLDREIEPFPRSRGRYHSITATMGPLHSTGNSEPDQPFISSKKKGEDRYKGGRGFRFSRKLN